MGKSHESIREYIVYYNIDYNEKKSLLHMTAHKNSDKKVQGEIFRAHFWASRVR